MPNEQLGELLAVATALLWTCSTIAWSFAGRYMGAIAVSFLRLVIAGVLLILHCRYFRGLWLPSDADAQTWLLLGASGVMGFFVADVCLFKAIHLIGPRLALLILSLSPPIAALISLVALDDALSACQWCGMAITLGGVTWVVLEGADDAILQPRHWLKGHHWTQGVLLGVAAAIAQAAGLVLSKSGIGDYDRAAATLIRALPALAAYVLVITLTRRWRTMVNAARKPAGVGILFGGAIIGPYLGVMCSLEALRLCPTGVVATIIATMPVMILPASIWLFRERVSPRAFLGAVLSVIGVALLTL